MFNKSEEPEKDHIPTSGNIDARSDSSALSSVSAMSSVKLVESRSSSVQSEGVSPLVVSNTNASIQGTRPPPAKRSNRVVTVLPTTRSSSSIPGLLNPFKLMEEDRRERESSIPSNKPIQHEAIKREWQEAVVEDLTVIRNGMGLSPRATRSRKNAEQSASPSRSSPERVRFINTRRMPQTMIFARLVY